MIHAIITDLEERVLAVDVKLAAMLGNPSNIHEEMMLRGQRQGLNDAIHAVRMLDLGSILNKPVGTFDAALKATSVAQSWNGIVGGDVDPE